MFTLVFSLILGVRRGALAAIIGIIIYTLFVGANPAVVLVDILEILTKLCIDDKGWVENTTEGSKRWMKLERK